MRPATRWTFLRHRLVRLARRVEILVSPALGAVTYVLGLALGGILLVAIAALWVVMLPLVLLVLRMGTRASRNLVTERDVEKIIRTGYLKSKPPIGAHSKH